MSQKPSQIVENIKSAIPAIAKVIPGGWDNIQSLLIKTNSSVSLPVWSCSLEDTNSGRWHGLGLKEVSVASEDEEEDKEDTASLAQNPKKSKSRKRSSTSDDEKEEVAPRKKAKSLDGLTRKTKEKPGAETVSPSKSQKSKKPTEPARSAKRDKVTAQTPLALDVPKKKVEKSSGPTKSASRLSSSKAKASAQVKPDGKMHKKEVSGVDTAAVSKPTLKEETKLKYPSASLERKKRLMIKAKGNKGIKSSFLGKRVAQR